MRCRGGSRTAPTEAAVVPAQMVPPSFLRSLSSWKRGAGIHPPPIAQIPLVNRPKSPCKSLTTQSPLLYHSVQSFPERGARPWRTLGAVVPAWAVARYRRGHIPRLTWRDGQPPLRGRLPRQGLTKLYLWCKRLWGSTAKGTEIMDLSIYPTHNLTRAGPAVLPGKPTLLRDWRVRRPMEFEEPATTFGYIRGY